MFKFIKWVLFLIHFSSALFAQNSIIKGFVVEKETNRPVEGVHVLLERINIMTESNNNGQYTLKDIPPGTYNLRVHAQKVKELLLKNFTVKSNTVIKQDFALVKKNYSAKKEVSQVYENTDSSVIRYNNLQFYVQNISDNVTKITASEIERLPIRDLKDILTIQPGVVIRDGNIHIRGARAEEVGYYLDGASITNPINNMPFVHIIPEAVEELNIVTGGYTSGFGNANGGLVLSYIKTGPERLTSTFTTFTDRFSSKGKSFLGTYSYLHNTNVITVGGPAYYDNIRFFIAYENLYQGDSRVRFSKGFQFDDLPDREQDGLYSISYPDGFTPHNTLNRNTINGSLVFYFLPFSLRLSGAWNSSRHYNDDAPWLNLLNTRLYYDDEKSTFINAHFKHQISSELDYDIQLSKTVYNIESGDSFLGHNWKTWYDSSKVNIASAYSDAWTPSPSHLLNAFSFKRNGTPHNFYRKQDLQSFSASFNMRYKIEDKHHITFGLSTQSHTIRYFDIAPHVMLYTANPSITAWAYGSIINIPVRTWIGDGGVDAYGYDIYGNKISKTKYYNDGSYVDGPKKPVYKSAYIEDKILYKNWQINAGLRLDYYDLDTQNLRNPSDIQSDDQSNFILPEEWKGTDPITTLSHRFSLINKFAAGSYIYSNFGRYTQMPQMGQLYFSQRRYSQQVLHVASIDNESMGFHLKPLKKTKLEIGIHKQVTDIFSFHTSLYYNLSKNLPGNVLNADSDPEYMKLSSFEKSQATGLIFDINIQPSSNITANIKATISKAKGDVSNTFHGDISTGLPVPAGFFTLDNDQLIKGTIDIGYRFDENSSHPVFKNININALFNYSSGFPFTRTEIIPGGGFSPYGLIEERLRDDWYLKFLEDINSSRIPDYHNLDLRIDKTFSITNDLDATFYVRINNLLNTKNIINLYPNTGQPDVDGIFEMWPKNLFSEGHLNMYDAIIENGGAYSDILGKELYSRPRQIFFGLRLAY